MLRYRRRRYSGALSSSPWVRFKIYKDSLPLLESSFRQAIEYDYQKGTKFSQELNKKQPLHLPVMENHWRLPFPRDPFGVGLNLSQSETVLNLQHQPYVEIASHNIFSHAGGNNGVVHSPQQMCHLFHGRNTIISMPGSFESPNECVRNFSHSRNESNSNNADKKQYELDIDRIIHGEDSRTTLMIKNIWNKYTSKVLLAAIDDHCQGTYDFIYFSIDFKAREKFSNEKVASLAYASIQGKAVLIAHFQNSSLINEDKRCYPILCHTDGLNAGDPESFPMGINIGSKPGKPQTTSPENNHQGSSSTSAIPMG
ncbi:hypothetical protein SLEP1_g52627 [Rubroshorea leprosula]|uniref:DCD domain-containing protein n=1 Tax=Rubroshorea leprosula TaxID=152421 RepID=A0AAV5M9J2_9ROSI|nr:hypothetical protein SLEP1_g52627 [Rubroshorea leprosula]